MSKIPSQYHPWRGKRKLAVAIKTKKQAESRVRSSEYRKRNKK